VTEPRRVRVVHPRTEAASRGPIAHPRTEAVVLSEGDGATGVDEIYLRTLIRGQARIALLVVGATAVLLGGVAVLGAVWPAYGHARVAGLPVSWLLLGAGVYPLLLALAWYAVREAERNETDFRALARRR
jgi:hypothetical protein